MVVWRAFEWERRLLKLVRRRRLQSLLVREGFCVRVLRGVSVSEGLERREETENGWSRGVSRERRVFFVWKPKRRLEVRFAVHGSWFKVRGSRAFVRRRVGAGFSAAGPRVPRGHVPPGIEVPTELREVPFLLFLFIWVFGVCVCEASSVKVELVSCPCVA